MCRPKRNQTLVYNGHRRVHALKFQSVVVPNGMILNIFRPVRGRKHYSALFAMSGLLNQLQDRSFSPNGPVLYIYGDPAYPHRYVIGLFVASLSFMCSLSYVNHPVYMYILIVMCRVRERVSASE